MSVTKSIAFYCLTYILHTNPTSVKWILMSTLWVKLTAWEVTTIYFTGNARLLRTFVFTVGHLFQSPSPPKEYHNLFSHILIGSEGQYPQKWMALDMSCFVYRTLPSATAVRNVGITRQQLPPYHMCWSHSLKSHVNQNCGKKATCFLDMVVFLSQPKFSRSLISKVLKIK